MNVCEVLCRLFVYLQVFKIEVSWYFFAMEETIKLIEQPSVYLDCIILKLMKLRRFSNKTNL